MRRKLFNIASVLSLLLCLATVALWVRSYWQSYNVHYESAVANDQAWGVRVGVPRGLVSVQRYSAVVRPGLEMEYQRDRLSESGWRPGWRLEVHESVSYASPTILIRELWVFLLRFASSTNAPSDPEVSLSSTTLIFPLWVLVLVLAAPEGFRLYFWLRLRQRRSPRGHCPTCRYDLTGNTSGVCPECGCGVRRDVRIS